VLLMLLWLVLLLLAAAAAAGNTPRTPHHLSPTIKHCGPTVAWLYLTEPYCLY
jgi:hypothetical protein